MQEFTFSIAIDPALVRMAAMGIHVIAAGLTLQILKLDFDLVFRPNSFVNRDLQRVMQMAIFSLAFLWATGTTAILIDTGGNLLLIFGKPKVLAKLTVVTLLTVNGWWLHKYAFPRLMEAQSNTTDASVWASVFGAISTISWVYANFLGVARPLTQPPYQFGYADYILPYLGLIMVGVLLATLLFRYRVERIIVANSAASVAGRATELRPGPFPDQQRLSAQSRPEMLVSRNGDPDATLVPASEASRGQ